MLPTHEEYVFCLKIRVFFKASGTTLKSRPPKTKLVVLGTLMNRSEYVDAKSVTPSIIPSVILYSTGTESLAMAT